MKLFKVLLLSISLLTVSVAPKKSEAALGVAITAATPALGIAAILLGAGLAGGSGYMWKVVYKQEPKPVSASFIAFTTVFFTPGILSGLLILDENGETCVQFKAIDSAASTKLKLSSEKVEVFNQELEEVNAIFETVKKKSIQKYAQADLKQEKVQKEIFELGTKSFKAAVNHGQLSAETFDVIQKIRTQK